MSRKICVISGTRAEWYLLKNLCKQIKKDEDLKLQLILTASHLSKDFGFTYKEIEKEFKIDKKIDILLSNDNNISLCKSMALLEILLCEALFSLKPDIVVILGDRYEMLAVASVCLIMQIPLAHICGGELTLGAIDDSIRHSITKMAHLHFVSTKEYKKRVLQLGEDEKRVFNVGSLGGELINNINFLDKKTLEDDLNIKFKENIYLITYHPQTINKKSIKKQINTLLNFLDTIENASLIFTKANADENGFLINEMIKLYCEKKSFKARLFDNLGSLRYLSLMKICKAVIGNSSSGICESPFLRIPCINIGDRQRGRMCAKNIINCEISNLKQAFEKLACKQYKQNLRNFINPFYSENTSYNIKEILKTYDLQAILNKEFIDYECK
ncbi:UDP-N-acetylglucosamine 2-epimerase [Campylobacter sp.]|uniref:UDP-N-acetylglucosamine 2-epimerase n=1 Tax=Campylobacter sp. TaxID=205 RepID=UPI0025C317EB|nr:UDP-N-acetylglucosamine 2-epimerase [Campylobacter sp.]